MKRYNEIMKRLAELSTESRKEETTTERLKEISAEVDLLVAEKKQIEEERASLEARFNEGNVVRLTEQEVQTRKVEPEDPYDTMEYRKAFRDYVIKRDKRIEKLAPEMRTDEVTALADVGAIIPTTILSQILQKMLDYGEIFSKVTMLNYPGGVSIPIGGTKPTATWTAESAVADKQKFEASTNITFSYFKLQIRVAINLTAATVSLPIWESTVAQNIAEAMVIALETAVINGAGTTEPRGILLDHARVPTAQKVDVVVADFTWTGWNTKLLSNIPTAYKKRPGNVILTHKLTWYKYMAGMVDDQKQPIARQTYGINGEEILRFMGIPVILTDLLDDWDSGSNTDVFLIYGNLKDYAFNTNLQIRQRNYFDEDTDEYIQKTTMITDGRMVDPYGFVFLAVSGK